MKRGWWILKGFVFAALFITVFGTATMLLWNWLVPVLFSGPVITFPQALGLLVLTKILFWSPNKGGRHHGPWRRSRWQGHHWKSQMREKWNTMTPEEREKLKEKIRGKWCGPQPEEKSSANV